jgi:N4-gp56 family major capsid protein
MEKLFKINLQLFAELNTQTTLTESLSPEMKTFYDKALLREAEANLVHGQFGQKRPIPKNGGKTIEFRKFDSLPKALTPLTEGVTPNGNKLSVTAITATVKQYGDYIVQSDVLELTSIDNTIVEATRILGNQAGLTLDTIDREELNSASNVVYAPKVAADGTKTEVKSRANLDKTATLTVDLVKKCATILKSVNAPKIDGCYVAIIHPLCAYDLMADPKWMEVEKYASPNNMLVGEIGKIGGVRFVESTEAKIFTTDGGASDCPENLAVYSTLFLGADAYGVTTPDGGGLQTIIKQKGSAGTGDPLDQRSSVGWKAMRVTKILLDSYIVRCESCGEFSDTAKAN